MYMQSLSTNETLPGLGSEHFMLPVSVPEKVLTPLAFAVGPFTASLRKPLPRQYVGIRRKIQRITSPIVWSPEVTEKTSWTIIWPRKPKAKLRTQATISEVPAFEKAKEKRYEKPAAAGRNMSSNAIAPERPGSVTIDVTLYPEKTIRAPMTGITPTATSNSKLLSQYAGMLQPLITSWCFTSFSFSSTTNEVIPAGTKAKAAITMTPAMMPTMKSVLPNS
mmetsp:Transcript_26680/g.42768  ORF Transcript_26680/g.42768 Transcript_26680/m.42768 type:complete len:221 (+) Transcript_26680:2324-2986(+)